MWIWHTKNSRISDHIGESSTKRKCKRMRHLPPKLLWRSIKPWTCSKSLRKKSHHLQVPNLKAPYFWCDPNLHIARQLWSPNPNPASRPGLEPLGRLERVRFQVLSGWFVVQNMVVTEQTNVKKTASDFRAKWMFKVMLTLQQKNKYEFVFSRIACVKDFLKAKMDETSGLLGCILEFNNFWRAAFRGHQSNPKKRNITSRDVQDPCFAASESSYISGRWKWWLT